MHTVVRQKTTETFFDVLYRNNRAWHWQSAFYGQEHSVTWDLYNLYTQVFNTSYPWTGGLEYDTQSQSQKIFILCRFDNRKHKPKGFYIRPQLRHKIKEGRADINSAIGPLRCIKILALYTRNLKFYKMHSRNYWPPSFVYLHIAHLQLSPFHWEMSFLKFSYEFSVLIWWGKRFHVVAAIELKLFEPYLTVLVLGTHKVRSCRVEYAELVSLTSCFFHQSVISLCDPLALRTVLF